MFAVLEEWPIPLGSKLDECPSCGWIGSHSLVRTTSWLVFLVVPCLLIGLHNFVICDRCGLRMEIPLRDMLRGIRRRSLPLQRPRVRFSSLTPADGEDRPTESEFFDPVTLRAGRTFGGWYLLAWLFSPVFFALLFVAVALYRMSRGYL